MGYYQAHRAIPESPPEQTRWRTIATALCELAALGLLMFGMPLVFYVLSEAMR